MFNFLKKKKEPAHLCVSTDIHCHLVPGVDDGARDAATAAEIIERMQSWGVKRIIASPHVTQDTFENTPEELVKALAELQAELNARGNNIELSRSAEYRIDDYSMSQINSGVATTLPNSYILVENAFMQEPWGLDQLLFDLQVKGLRPILAHPERYFYYHKNQRRYDKIHAAGTCFQVNMLSLAGYYGKEEKAIAESLVAKGYVDFLGTDIHHHRHVDSIEAYLQSKDYSKILPKLNLQNDKAF